MKSIIARRIERYTGYVNVDIEVSDSSISVWSDTDGHRSGWQLLLRYDLDAHREIYGRVRNCGISIADLQSIRYLEPSEV